MSHSGPQGAFHIPGVTVEQQFDDIEKELQTWRVGDAMLDARARAAKRFGANAVAVRTRQLQLQQQFSSRTDANSIDKNNRDGGDDDVDDLSTSLAALASNTIDTIRLSKARDQRAIQMFLAQHLPTSLRQKQVTNFEVRRLMQRTRNNNCNNGAIGAIELEQRQQHRDGNDYNKFDDGTNNNNNNNSNNSTAASATSTTTRTAVITSSSPTSTILAGIDRQVLARKSLELYQFVRESAQERARLMPLPPSERRKRRRNNNNDQLQQQIGDSTAVSLGDRGSNLHRDGNLISNGKFHHSNVDDESGGENNSNTSNQHLMLEEEQQQRQQQQKKKEQRAKDISIWYHRLGLEVPKVLPFVSSV